MKYLFVAAIGLIFVGCGSSNHLITYHPPGSAASTWSIKTVKNEVTGDLEVRVNDSTVCAASSGIFRFRKRMSGTYRGHQVTATLQYDDSYRMEDRMTCLILIDGEKIGPLEW